MRRAQRSRLSAALSVVLTAISLGCSEHGCIHVTRGRRITDSEPLTVKASSGGDVVAWCERRGEADGSSCSVFRVTVGAGSPAPQHVADQVLAYELGVDGTLALITRDHFVRLDRNGRRSVTRVSGAASLIVSPDADSGSPVGVLAGSPATLLSIVAGDGTVTMHGQVSFASLSAGGRYLAFSGCRGSDGAVCVVAVPSQRSDGQDGMGLGYTAAVESNALEFEWASRSPTLATRSRTGALRVATAPAFESRELAPNVRAFEISPDGGWIAYVDDQRVLRTVSMRSGAQPTVVDRHVSSFSIAPTGDRVGYLSGCTRDDCTLLVSPVVGGRAASGSKVAGLVTSFAFAPAGSRVLLWTRGLALHGKALVVGDGDEGILSTEVMDGDAIWAGPEVVAYVQRRERGHGLYLAPISTNVQRR